MLLAPRRVSPTSTERDDCENFLPLPLPGHGGKKKPIEMRFHGAVSVQHLNSLATPPFRSEIYFNSFLYGFFGYGKVTFLRWALIPSSPRFITFYEKHSILQVSRVELIFNTMIYISIRKINQIISYYEVQSPINQSLLKNELMKNSIKSVFAYCYSYTCVNKNNETYWHSGRFIRWGKTRRVVAKRIATTTTTATTQKEWLLKKLLLLHCPSS